MAKNRAINGLAFENQQIAEEESNEDDNNDFVSVRSRSFDIVLDGGSNTDADSSDSQLDRDE